MAKSKRNLSEALPIPKRSFDPISVANARVLILGSLPGDRSLELQQYYGHSQNRFWKILASVFHTPLPVTYEEKLQFLADNNIAVWDVAHQALRPGSLDSAIKNAEPNKLDEFIDAHAELEVIAFNGQKARQLFDKFFEEKAGINYVTLPSSSPANAGKNLTSLIDEWRHALR